MIHLQSVQEYGYWVGVVVVSIVLAILCIERWVELGVSYANLPDKKKPFRHFGKHLVLTLLGVAGILGLVVVQGHTAPMTEVRLHGNADPRKDFLDADQRSRQEVRPLTPSEVDAERAAKEARREQQAQEQGQRTDEAIGEDMKDFRQRVLDRQKKDAEQTPPNGSSGE